MSIWGIIFQYLRYESFQLSFHIYLPVDSEESTHMFQLKPRVKSAAKPSSQRGDRRCPTNSDITPLNPLANRSKSMC